MPSFIKEANYFVDNTNTPQVEIKYTIYVEGLGYVNLAECFATKPIGNWKNYVSRRESRKYTNFLETEVHKTLEIRRRLIELQLDNVMCENNNIFSIIRIMNCIKILDPTFIPPVINVRCSWQKQFARYMATEMVTRVSNSCKNEYRLERLYSTLIKIEEEL
jgi:predicted component of type VI protein secretion system